MKVSLTLLFAMLAALPCCGLPKPSRQKQRCGPPVYCAESDRRIKPLQKPFPVWGPAGSIMRDPSFHSRILRVTDAALPLRYHRPPVSFFTSASAEQNTWNTNSTRFYVTVSNGSFVVFNFDPRAMRATPEIGHYPVWRPDAEFSYVNPNLMYGWTGRVHPVMQEFDLTSRRATTIFDPASCVEEEPNDYGHAFSISADDNRLMGVFGPEQDRDHYVVVYDRKRGCRWYDTETGTVGGMWGPKGPATLPDHFRIHNARISRSGDYVVIAGHGLVFWQVGTQNVIQCRRDQHCKGHWVLGYSHFINQPGIVDDMNIFFRPFSNLNAVRPLVTPLPKPPEWGLDSHWSWNNDNRNDTAPVCGSTYAEQLPVNHVSRPWDGEVICMRTDGKSSTVWRFAHTYTTARNGFWSTPRGNVSQDGRFFMFTSDWEDTLGKDPRGRPRTDVFIVELK